MGTNLIGWLLPILLLPFVLAGAGDSSFDPPPPLVETKQGTLEGLTFKSRKGNTYFGFRGVRYANAPVRFGLSQPPDSWEGVKKATEFLPPCFQFSVMKQKLVGVENCLVMNIYTPKLDGNAPVIVLIHGGGFQSGSGHLFNAKYFMDEDVVLIVIQYRLGALGFLNFEDDTVPGNNGLRDQSNALKYVKENIASFGGDPNKVTIMGFSAGGASVHYQMLSPLSKGLFNYGISQSGSALNPWAEQKKPKELAIRLAKNVGCPHETSEEMVKCFRSKTPEELLTGQLKLSTLPPEFDMLSMLFTPSVEKGTKEQNFLEDTPYNIITSGRTASKVPWINGIAAEEGALYIAIPIEKEESLQKINADWEEMAPSMLYYDTTTSPSAQNLITRKVKEFYFGGKSIGTDSHLELGRVFGDRFFNAGVARAITEHAKRQEFPVYPYIFNFTGSNSVQKDMFHSKNSYGVGHTDDTPFLFDAAFGCPEYSLDTKEGKFSEKLVKLYASFAKEGKPTATWGPEKSWEPFVISEENKDKSEIAWYMLDEETRVLREDPFKPRTDFWESLPLRELDKVDLQEGKDEL